MKVTTASQTAEGKRYSLNNGDALLMKVSGRTTYPVYVFANGRTYSARTGRFSRSTVIPACVAVQRFEVAA